MAEQIQFGHEPCFLRCFEGPERFLKLSQRSPMCVNKGYQCFRGFTRLSIPLRHTSTVTKESHEILLRTELIRTLARI